MQRLLVTIGVLCLLIGLGWPWISKLPLGRLPGDILIERPDFKVYVPITTLLLVSAVLSLILYLLRR